MADQGLIKHIWTVVTTLIHFLIAIFVMISLMVPISIVTDFVSKYYFSANLQALDSQVYFFLIAYIAGGFLLNFYIYLGFYRGENFVDRFAEITGISAVIMSVFKIVPLLDLEVNLQALTGGLTDSFLLLPVIYVSLFLKENKNKKQLEILHESGLLPINLPKDSMKSIILNRKYSEIGKVSGAYGYLMMKQSNLLKSGSIFLSNIYYFLESARWLYIFAFNTLILNLHFAEQIRIVAQPIIAVTGILILIGSSALVVLERRKDSIQEVLDNIENYDRKEKNLLHFTESDQT